jgi:hypothetical protein
MDNGIGPTWFPKKLRTILKNKKFEYTDPNDPTGKSTIEVDWVPRDAQIEHDFEYTIGGSKFDRHRADAKLLDQMLCNFEQLPTHLMWKALFLVDAMFILLRFVGPFAYNYVPESSPLMSIADAVAIACQEKQQKPIEEGKPPWLQMIIINGKYAGLFTLAFIIMAPVFILFLFRQAIWGIMKLLGRYTG